MCGLKKKLEQKERISRLIIYHENNYPQLKCVEGRPKLALNGVGGKSCLQISSLLSRGGMLVTYGSSDSIILLMQFIVIVEKI